MCQNAQATRHGVSNCAPVLEPGPQRQSLVCMMHVNVSRANETILLLGQVRLQLCCPRQTSNCSTANALSDTHPSMQKSSGFRVARHPLTLEKPSHAKGWHSLHSSDFFSAIVVSHCVRWRSANLSILSPSL